MARRALVIGAETGGLSGVNNDTRTMSTALAEWGFEVEVRRDKDATQAGIREGLARLVADTRADDAVVIYYSGHGGVARVRSLSGIELPERRFIVPTDFDESSPGDFRGVTSIELSVWVARLTERTRNVTIIMDCCHAARMVRDSDLKAKALPRPTYLDVAEHTGMLRALGLPVDTLHPIANPHALRLAACRPEQSAYEYTARDGLRTGIFTESLRRALDEAGQARVSWATLMRRVQQRVLTLEPSQRPEAEGPWSRTLFDAEELVTRVALPVVVADANRVTLPGAALLGVSPGDTFAITPPGTPAATGATTLARAKVTKVHGVTVEAGIEFSRGGTQLPHAAEAHPLVTSAVRDPVLVRGSGALAGIVRSRIDEVPTLRTVGEDHHGPVLAEVTVDDGGMALRDGGPAPLATERADEAGLGRIMTHLQRMARTAVLRRLAPRPGETLTDAFEVEWGRVVDQRREPLPPAGARLHVGESVYVRLRNDSNRSLYFWVFDLGVAHRVALVSVEHSGLLLRPGQEEIIGRRIDGPLIGNPLVWPDGLSADGPRPETLLVIVTTEPHDLSGLIHDGVQARTPRGTSPLARELAAACGTAARDWAQPRADGFAAVYLDFDLDPEPAPPPETARFAIDERPSFPARAARRDRAVRAADRTVAVRITDMVVQDNRSLGRADIRVDTLVLTGGAGGRLPDLARTAWFGRVRDGDRLPLDNLLIYHGPAVDYLDIAWWVSRDDARGKALAELLRDRLTDPAFQTVVQSLSVVSPPVGLALSAVSAGVLVVDTAYELLSQAVHGTVGVYRTSFLSSEDFGIGRHPAHGSFTVQGFSFAYEIVDVG